MASKKQLPGSPPSPKLNSFFSGIGGFEVAFERAGFTVSFHCEKNKFCHSVLERHWPSVPMSEDISTLQAADVPVAPVWTAGFPCQDLSLARTPHGRAGLKGAQSGLFFKLLDLMAAHKPKVVLIENVAGLLNSHNGQDFRTLIESLTELGYGVAWRTLNARYFGAPQSRPRVFICAWFNNPEKATKALFEEELAAQPNNERAAFVTSCAKVVQGAVVPQLSFCISATSGRHTGLDWARSYVTYKHAVRRLTPVECERLQGFEDNWTVPSAAYRVPSRGIDTERYHAAGNAVCVPVVEWIAHRISTLLTSKSRSRPVAGIETLQRYAKEFTAPTARTIMKSDILDSIKWRSGGVAYKDMIVDASSSTAPCQPIVSRLSDVLEKTAIPEKYFLSPNAAQGIIRRVDKLGRKLFKPLDTTLRTMAGTAGNTTFESAELTSDESCGELAAA